MSDERLNASRHHALDALRAAMMLLGLVLHSAASYTRTPLGDAWPYHDPHTNVVFDLLVFFIHLFRMPLFFVIAGFFAALLYSRDGRARFVRNRARRVLVPLLIFWPIIVPLGGLGFVFAVGRLGGDLPLMPVPNEPLIRQPILGHLWFLYYLLIFYAAPSSSSRSRRGFQRACGTARISGSAQSRHTPGERFCLVA